MVSFKILKYKSILIRFNQTDGQSVTLSNLVIFKSNCSV
jgi:hypothetical protein